MKGDLIVNLLKYIELIGAVELLIFINILVSSRKDIIIIERKENFNYKNQKNFLNMQSTKHMFLQT